MQISWSLSCAFSFILCCSGICQSTVEVPIVSKACTKNCGTLNGKVVDPKGNLLLGGRVAVSSGGLSRSVQTDANGSFQFVLTPGLYEITSQLEAWYPVRRSQIVIRAGCITNVTLFPPLRISSISSTVSKNGMTEPMNLLVQPKYDVFKDSNDRPEIVIEYADKRAIDDRILYEKAIVTYGSLSVRGESITYSPSIKELRASGSVWIERNGISSNENEATLALSEENPCAN